jgi:DNA-binding beta-propeller fold protein YncE
VASVRGDECLQSRVKGGSFAVPRSLPARIALFALGGCLALSACAGSKTGGGESEYVLIPPSPQQSRIQFLTTYNSDVDVLPPLSPFRRFVLGDRQARELRKPYGVAMHDGQILVCDTELGVVVVFDLRAQTVEILGGGPQGKLGKPLNIAVDEDGTRYVADAELKRVVVYAPNNGYLRAIGDPEAWSPTDVAIIGKRLYVTDIENGDVVLIEKETGKELRRFNRGEEEDVQKLFLATNLTVGIDGSVYVTETGSARVLQFDSRGKRLKQFGSLGRLMGQFVRPKGVAVDREGRVYVVDAANQRVQIFNDEAKLLLFFGGVGNQPGGLNLPAQVAIDYDNVDLFADLAAPGYKIEYLVLVTSQFGANKVSVFGFLEPDEATDE